ncbi:MAG TPA: hypothetical protein VE974_18815 [Thermoanaerobaculia bacterium]|nr:hypothetical protein [Thermoanaerobaculia bacterium]
MRNASAPIAAACGPTCTRTSAKLVRNAVSTCRWMAGGNGCPPPRAKLASCGGKGVVRPFPCGKYPWITFDCAMR